LATVVNRCTRSTNRSFMAEQGRVGVIAFRDKTV
jgi:hypothetical protein